MASSSCSKRVSEHCNPDNGSTSFSPQSYLVKKSVPRDISIREVQWGGGGAAPVREKERSQYRDGNQREANDTALLFVVFGSTLKMFSPYIQVSERNSEALGL